MTLLNTFFAMFWICSHKLRCKAPTERVSKLAIEQIILVLLN